MKSSRRLLLITLILISLVFSSSMFAADKDNKLSIPELVKKCGPAVVMVLNYKGKEMQAIGSGFLIDSKGTFVTNYHVVSNATSLQIKLTSGHTYRVVQIKNIDKEKDIAILKAEGFELPYLTLGNSNQVAIGENCIAIGNPEGLENTVSNGIISGMRVMEGRSLIQITAPISHGSSGGPLLNDYGKVVGVTTMGIQDAQNLNFAVPINTVRAMLDSKLSFTFNDLIDETEAETDDKKTTEKNDENTAGRYILATKSQIGDFYFDKETMQAKKDQDNKPYIDVWVLRIFVAQDQVKNEIKYRRQNKLPVNGYENLAYQFCHYAFNNENQFCLIEYEDYSKDNKAIYTFQNQELYWEDLNKDSVLADIVVSIVDYINKL